MQARLTTLSTCLVRHKRRIAYIGIGIVLILVLLSQIPPKRDPAQKSYLGRQGLPRGVRNNNPGNLRYSPMNLWQGKVPYTQNTDLAFEQFVEWRYGVRALLVLLKKYIFRYGTIEDIIRVYAPDTENNTEAYIAAVSASTGIPRSQAITSDKTTLQRLCRAISQHECGAVYAVTQEDFNNAYQLL